MADDAALCDDCKNPMASVAYCPVTGHPHEYGIEVADRGCQTFSGNEQGTQTDPDPHILYCTHCYEDYYGHSGHSGSKSKTAPAPEN
eukprot:gene5465-2442_t